MLELSASEKVEAAQREGRSRVTERRDSEEPREAWREEEDRRRDEKERRGEELREAWRRRRPEEKPERGQPDKYRPPRRKTE
jgi:hypothetical protein